MIYTIEKANLTAGLIRKFTTGYAHHVVGQFANIDFWIHEVQEAIKTIDEYNTRFSKMYDDQKKWIDAHNTRVYDYCVHCGGKCELSKGTPAPLIRTPHIDLKNTRKELVDAAYFFLLRCHRMGLLNKDLLKIRCKEVGTSLDPTDL